MVGHEYVDVQGTSQHLESKQSGTEHHLDLPFAVVSGRSNSTNGYQQRCRYDMGLSRRHLCWVPCINGPPVLWWLWKRLQWKLIHSFNTSGYPGWLDILAQYNKAVTYSIWFIKSKMLPVLHTMECKSIVWEDLRVVDVCNTLKECSMHRHINHHHASTTELSFKEWQRKILHCLNVIEQCTPALRLERVLEWGQQWISKLRWKPFAIPVC